MNKIRLIVGTYDRSKTKEERREEFRAAIVEAVKAYPDPNFKSDYDGSKYPNYALIVELPAVPRKDEVITIWHLTKSDAALSITVDAVWWEPLNEVIEITGIITDDFPEDMGATYEDFGFTVE